MIAVESNLLVRVTAPLVWRSEARIARKLESFAATEAGSALDMLKAAELTPDPLLRRLFFRHAMDEARHAQLFRAAARALVPGAARSEYQLIHATRQNLYERLGPVRFLAFVYLAERRGERQFRALANHFRARSDRPELAALFTRIGRDERFHVRYSRKLLMRLRRAGRSGEVRRALARVRLDRALAAWRRAGRLFGDASARVLLGLVYLVALGPFALVQRALDPERPGWRPPAPADRTLEEARRQI